MKREALEQMLRLQQDANERRLRLASNVGELRVRMRPGNLWSEAKQASLAEVDRVTDELLEAATDFLEDSVDWVSRHRSLAIGGAAVGALAAGLWAGFGRRRKPVPLYAAYNKAHMDADPELRMVADDLAENDMPGQAGEQARQSGRQVSTSFDNARLKLRMAADDVAACAADVAALARNQAGEAGAAMKDVAARAADLAGEATDWTRRNWQQMPGTVLLAGLVAGACLGVLTASGADEAEE